MVGAMAAVVPVALAGDALEVPCADGGQRPYLSFDAAAATGALPSVLDAVQAFVPWYASAQGAAGYKSQASAITYECARLAALAFADRGTASDDAVLFCRNATEAIRHLADRLRLSRDDVVVTTVAEHQANVLPWSRAANCRYVECGKDGTFDTEDVVAALGQWPRPALLAITGASGITGWMPPLPDIIDAAHRRGVPVLADVAQLAPHHPLPADADFLVWSGHKMYAPFGTGVLIGPRRVLAENGPAPGSGWLTERDRRCRPARGHGNAQRRRLANDKRARAPHRDLDAARPGRDPGRSPARPRCRHANAPGRHLHGGRRPACPGGGATGRRVCDRSRAQPVRRGPLPDPAPRPGRRGRPPARPRAGDRRAVPGAVRASAGINVTDDDVRRLLAAVADVAAGDPPVPYRQDPSTGDFFPAVSTFPERAA